MRLQLWTPTFRLEEETSIVPIWVTFPELSWHCYYMEVLSHLLAPIGKALYLDSTSIQKTRGNVAKVRVQMDITKDRPQHIWNGFNEDDITVGRWRLIQYEDIPDYCGHCKHQGHSISNCMIKKREDKVQRKRDLEAAPKSGNVSNEDQNHAEK